MNASSVKLLIVFGVAFSLASLGGPMSSHFSLPSVQLGHANLQQCQTHGSSGACSEFWYPAGPSMDTQFVTIYADQTTADGALLQATPQEDMVGSAVPTALVSEFTTGSSTLITQGVETHFYSLEFNLANSFWNCDSFNFGNSQCGIDIRQGIAHLVDKENFAANEKDCSGSCSAIDNPELLSSGLASPNPCAWDSANIETGSQCIVGAKGGTAYHIASATGADSIAWLPSPGSADLNAAAAHFVAAGIATGFNPSTSVLTGISSSAQQNVPTIFVDHDNNVLVSFGESFAYQICYLFSGFYALRCSYLNEVEESLTSFPGLQTSTTSVSTNWWMFTEGKGGPSVGVDLSQERIGPSLPEALQPQNPDPYDDTLYYTYNSRFTSGIPSIQPPCSSSAVPTQNAPDYVYLCNVNFDSLSNQMEVSPCLTATGDPAVGQPNNGPGGTCPNTTQLSAFSAGVQAENVFGGGAYSIPIVSESDQFAYLSNWQHVINAAGAGLPNYYTWLNAYTSSPAQPGTLRLGIGGNDFHSLNPYIAETSDDAMILGDIYDTLGADNPLSAQTMDWLAVSIQAFPNGSLSYTPPSGTVTTLRYTLRHDVFFQDGRELTSFDVAFSYLSMVGTGAYFGAGANDMTGITILGPSQFDINVKDSPLALITSMSGLPILPGFHWTVDPDGWNSRVNACTTTDYSCYPVQYALSGTSINCSLSCPPSNQGADMMDVDRSKITAFYDPLASPNNILIGSGPWTCGVVSSSGSGNCSSTTFQNPGVGGSYTLSRFGKGLAPASDIGGIYFRSAGNLALWFWSQDTGDLTHDFLNFSVVAACFGSAPLPLGTTTGCGHFQQGIGANGGPIAVGLNQVSIVNRFMGVNWVAPYNWAQTPPTGIGQLAPVLYEGGKTLNPASMVGCSMAYPTGGYDC